MTDVRMGTGFDAHAFGGPGPVKLGGVRIASDAGLVGHSDADVLAHAIADALLGAAALGDLGMHFPEADPRWEDVDSLEFLTHVTAILGEHRWTITNVDATVVCERPRVEPHRERMRQCLAEALGLELDRVSVKATTTDGLGFAGRGEGVAAHASATITR